MTEKQGRLQQWGVGGVIDTTSTPVQGSQTSISLQASLDPPSVFTVQFEVGPQSPENQRDNTPVATIEFACNGVTVRRKISVYNGASISGPGESVRVKAFDESTSPQRGPYAVNITVTPGTRSPADLALLMNDPEEIITKTNSVTFEVPQDAGAVSVKFLAVADPVTATMDPQKLSLLFLNSAGSTIAGQQAINHDFTEIPPGTTQITVQNNDAVDIRVRPVYGIDG